jgi:hypothetical protein
MKGEMNLKTDGSLCTDCGGSTYRMREYYMVTKEVWKEATQNKKAHMLCIGCLEKRLGRELSNKDFGNYLLNTVDWNKQSLRLLDRLNRKED